MMTIRELMEHLEDCLTEAKWQHGEDADPEVIIGHQPNWPMSATIGNVVIGTGPEAAYRPYGGNEDDDSPVVVIGEGSPIGYLHQGSRDAGDLLGW